MPDRFEEALIRFVVGAMFGFSLALVVVGTIGAVHSVWRTIAPEVCP